MTVYRVCIIRVSMHAAAKQGGQYKKDPEGFGFKSVIIPADPKRSEGVLFLGFDYYLFITYVPERSEGYI